MMSLLLGSHGMADPLSSDIMDFMVRLLEENKFIKS